MTSTSLITVNPVKDDDGAHPVPTQWRPAFHEIVKALANGDYGLGRGLPVVAPLADSRAEQLRRNIEEYGETLVELPEAAWNSSVALWMRTHWEVHVDLWTEESGESDLVLHARVFETDGDQIRIELRSIHVP